MKYIFIYQEDRMSPSLLRYCAPSVPKTGRTGSSQAVRTFQHNRHRCRSYYEVQDGGGGGGVHIVIFIFFLKDNKKSTTDRKTEQQPGTRGQKGRGVANGGTEGPGNRECSVSSRPASVQTFFTFFFKGKRSKKEERTNNNSQWSNARGKRFEVWELP